MYYAVWFMFFLCVFQAIEEAAAASSDSAINDVPNDKDNDKDAKKKKNRCATCRKKVGLTGKLLEQKFDEINHVHSVKPIHTYNTQKIDDKSHVLLRGRAE